MSLTFDCKMKAEVKIGNLVSFTIREGAKNTLSKNRACRIARPSTTSGTFNQGGFSHINQNVVTRFGRKIKAAQQYGYK